jgi:hypothetical protein
MVQPRLYPRVKRELRRNPTTADHLLVGDGRKLEGVDHQKVRGKFPVERSDGFGDKVLRFFAILFWRADQRRKLQKGGRGEGDKGTTEGAIFFKVG